MADVTPAMPRDPSGKPPLSADAEDFWQFSLALYGRPGIAAACLAWQDGHGLDVNLLLLGLWTGMRHGRRLSRADIVRLEQAVARWNAAVLTPLRAARLALKPGPATLYAAAKALELDAERQAQGLLLDALPALPARFPNGGDDHAVAAANLDIYLPGGAGAERSAILAALAEIQPKRQRMSTMLPGTKPEWLTFDCYGTLIQWDEGLLAAVETILARQPGTSVDARTLLQIHDKYEHELEQRRPPMSFRTVSAEGLKLAMAELGLSYDAADIEILTSGISGMPPFPEVVGALGELKRQGFNLCIISNTDDDIIAGNVAQLGGHIDRVITAQQAQAYKPSRRIFDYAHEAIGVSKDAIVHICASPHLDLVAARDIGFRCIWIDRGTGRQAPVDYTPDETFPAVDRVPAFFTSIGWA